VSVDHLGVVRVAQCVRHFACYLDGVADRKLALPEQTQPQGLAFDVRHHVVDQTAGLIRVVKGENVGMMETGGDLNFVQEAGGSNLGGQIGAKHFEGDFSLVLEIVSEKDRRHPPCPISLCSRYLWATATLNRSNSSVALLSTPRSAIVVSTSARY